MNSNTITANAGSSKTIITTQEQIYKAFAEWNRRYLEAPEGFVEENKYDDDAARVSADYLIELLHQVN